MTCWCRDGHLATTAPVLRKSRTSHAGMSSARARESVQLKVVFFSAAATTQTSFDYLHYNRYFPGGPGLGDIGMSPF